MWGMEIWKERAVQFFHKGECFRVIPKGVLFTAFPREAPEEAADWYLFAYDNRSEKEIVVRMAEITGWAKV